MTLLELRSTLAAYLQKTLPALTVNGVDLSILALNQVRREAEMLHDFEFSRRHVTITIDAIDGGTMLDAILEGSPACDVKSVIECGVYDDDFNVHPVEWTTVAESLERQRQIKPGFGPRYPADWEATTGYYDVGLQRIAICGDDIWMVPKGGAHKLIDLEFEVYAFTPDWSATSDSVLFKEMAGAVVLNQDTYWPYGIYNARPFYLNFLSGPPSVMKALWYSLAGGQWRVSAVTDVGKEPPTLVNYQSMNATAQLPGGSYVGHGTLSNAGIAEVTNGSALTDIWLKHGAQYLLWAGVTQVNHLCKEFVFRQEGNLPPPEKLAEVSLENFRQWDAFKYEQDRRHVY
jgi:hypothetical protein